MVKKCKKITSNFSIPMTTNFLGNVRLDLYHSETPIRLRQSNTYQTTSISFEKIAR